LQPVPDQPAAPIKLPNDPLATSQGLASEGRWGEALVLLDAAITQGWNNEDYLAAREETLQQKVRQEQKLQDRLLIERTKAQQAQLPIFTELVRLDPNNREANDGLKNIQQELKTNRKKLSECGLRHIELRSSLAQECLELALSLETTNRDQVLLDLITEKEKKTEQVKAQKKQDIHEQRRKSRIENSLQKANTLYEKDQFNAARKLLNQILAEEPANSQAKQLLSQLESRLENHLERLLKTGDRLYQEGEIEGALGIWEAALRLDPENPTAKEKIERATRVLENLEDLRQAKKVKDGSRQGP
jgi:predicted Zn-dependent protease